MLPVSQYEALLAEVRGLRRKAQHVQQLADPLISNCSTNNYIYLRNDQINHIPLYRTMDGLVLDRQHYPPDYNECTGASSADGDTTCSEDEYLLRNGAAPIQSSTSNDTASTPSHQSVSGSWRKDWLHEPINSDGSLPTIHTPNHLQEVTSVMSFNSSSGGVPLLGSPTNRSRRSSQQLEAKVDMVYSLLAMLGGQEHADMGETLLALSTNPESCAAMRQSGCIPLLVQLVQSDKDAETRAKASQALNNLVHSHNDEKVRKREVRILKLLENARAYTDALRNNESFDGDDSNSEDGDKHPVQTVAHLMKLSFDEGHRQAICQLGGIHTIANLVEAEHVIHSSTTEAAHCILMRRYACMALTNLTFGDSANKALLCSFREFMRALVAQLINPSDELRQVTASVLRNLSWRADVTSKEILREVGSVSGLMQASMYDNKENTLKSILSALWNLSAHCTENKSEICSVDGALGFLVDMLRYKSTTKSLAIVENAGGILRNISSQIAVRDDYREILRAHNCLEILLEQLKSPSLTIVSNACGTLWNLSAKCAEDQETLWRLGAPTMLRSLNHSKHKMIATGSTAALKNLLGARPTQAVTMPMDATALAMDLPVLPTLGARKQKALLQDLDQSLAETYENIEKDVTSSPVNEYVQKSSGSSRKKSSEGYGSLSNEPSTSYDAKMKNSKTSIDSCNVSYEKITIKSATSSTDDVFIGNEEVRTIKMRFKSKEVASCQDEKDRCSVESISEAESNMNEKIKSNNLLITSTDNSDKSNTLGESCGDTESSSCDELRTNRRNQTRSSTSPSSRLPLSSSRLTNRSRKASPSSSGLPLPTKSQSKVSVPIEETSSLSGPSSLPIHLPPLPTESVDESIDKNSPVNRRRVSALPRRSLTPIRINPERHNNAGPSTGVNVRNRLSNETDQVQTVKEMIVDTSTSSSNVVCGSIIEHKNNTMDIKKAGEPIVATKLSDKEPLSKTVDQPLSEQGESNITPRSSLESITPLSYSEHIIDGRLERSCEETSRLVDNRMLDPDAMIESLDRFTAELVSQASQHLENNDTDKFHNGTWNDDDMSTNDVTFPSVSGSVPNVITFDDERQKTIEDDMRVPRVDEEYTSLESSTLTASTLIAIEATKIAKAFETELSESAASAKSLELDQVQPPSMMNSLTNSGVGLERFVPKSPKLMVRKKSLPGMMIRRALSNSLNRCSSIESLDNNSCTNLEQINPPSAMGELADMEGSMSSVASLPHDTKPDFIINGYMAGSNDPTSITGLENVHPPSIFNEITDLCASLADVPTEVIGSETEVYQDCYTHLETTLTLQTEDDVTEFSDANSATPIQSDPSSPDITPKRKSSKAMTSKQKRNLARDRYKTYTVGAEILMQEERRQVEDESRKITPKERRRMDRSRFETRVLDDAITSVLQQPVIEPMPDQATSTARESFVRKRTENAERFKTRTIDETILITCEINESPNDNDLGLLVRKEADLVLRTLRETKTSDELLDCETLSLVSNDDESEHNSVSSINYRTYHKSWGTAKNNVPVIIPPENETSSPVDTINDTTVIIGQDDDEEQNGGDEKNDANITGPCKPRIVKPTEITRPTADSVPSNEGQDKAIRGRRKPLYSNKIAPKTIRPIRNMTSNLVKNVTSAIKSSTSGLRPKSSPQSHLQRPTQLSATKIAARPPPTPKTAAKPVLERQGTFTKEETASRLKPTSRIPAPRVGSGGTGSKSVVSKIPLQNGTSGRLLPPRSASATTKATTTEKSNRMYGRSTSADSRPEARRPVQTSGSSQSLKETKGRSAPQKSGSNTSLNSNGSTKKKQVTSKIASLWKKIEESKSKQQQTSKKDSRVWIDGNEADKNNGVVRRNATDANGDPTKRISRLGSFIVMDEGEVPGQNQAA